MKRRHFYNNSFYPLLLTLMLVLQSCIGDQQVATRKIIASNTTNNKNTCGDLYFLYAKGFSTCVEACETGYHAATADELTTIKNTLQDDADKTYDGVDTSLILQRVSNSYGVCVQDDPSIVRASDDISIKTDFCACLNGKSDLINNCDAFCAQKPSTNQPMLYVNTIPGIQTGANPKQGNLYNWCNVKLSNDESQPQCFLEYNNGSGALQAEINIASGSNSFSANISNLSRGKTYLLSVIESASGRNARTKYFQVRRKAYEGDDTETGTIGVSPVTQYSCLSYGTQISNGTASRTNYIKNFYYFPDDDRPTGMPAPAPGTIQTVVCHDDQKNPGNDSNEYERLESIPGIYSVWKMSDSLFVVDKDTSKLNIHTILDKRLVNEYGQTTANVNLFATISYPRRPLTSSSGSGTADNPVLGYVMGAFKDPVTKRTFCPTTTHFNTSTDPLVRLLGDYIGDTEGFYIAEKNAETITNSSGESQIIYGTMFVTESIILKHGFYIENNIKIKISESTLHSGKKVFYYWPIRENSDDLMAAGRKLYTVMTLDTINGNRPTTSATAEQATDKRLGCVPKSTIPTIPE